MKDILASLAVGLPVLILVVSGLIGLHTVLGENTGPALVLSALVAAVSIGVGALIRSAFPSTTVMYRLKQWVRK